MPHVLVAGSIHASGLALLDAAPDVETTYIEDTSVESLVRAIPEADAVILRTQPFTAEIIARAPRLQIASRHGVGYDSVDVGALSARGIPLAVCGDVNSTSVAEHAAMLILAASKRLKRADASVRMGPWDWRNELEARDVEGQRLLLVGYGRIGRKIGRMMQAFGLEIRAFDPFLRDRGWPRDGAPPVATLAEGLAWAEVISFSLPHSGAPLIGAAEFAAMRDGVVLVNTARGGIIDESALIAGLESGRIGAAGLDVFAEEPPAGDNPLLRFDNVVLTPHIGGLTEDAGARMAKGAVENVLAHFAGTLDPALVVNRDRIGAAHA